ncbi:hypothetical protein [Streptomyces sp. H27-C3]|uniref:hypothetical protein n=1 Tax=Streptomyces sp. H27-C3 TaxID=3046305 RepID=UPI0024BA45D9|nr:hypothetical protein [Streptomyces sp. H27-C3]MDJ0462772.1 hypothetical protein [Streptomyces sp. H27-C3]
MCFCTAAGSPTHVHRLSHAVAAVQHVAQPVDAPAAPAPHQPGDHCSRERGSVSLAGPDRLPATEAAPEHAADAQGAVRRATPRRAPDPPSPGSSTAQSLLCLWRI